MSSRYKKYKPYLRRFRTSDYCNSTDIMSCISTAKAETMQKMTNKKSSYVMAVHGIPNFVIMCGDSKEDIRHEVERHQKGSFNKWTHWMRNNYLASLESK